MNKYTKGIERALQMKQWNDKKGGLPARSDPFEGGEAGAFDRRVLQWLAELRRRGLSPATIETYRWPLLSFRAWLLSHHRGAFNRIGVLLTLRRVETFLAAPVPPASADNQSRAAMIGTLCRFSAWLAARGHVSTDPLRRLIRPKRPSRRLPCVLNPAQIARLLETPDTTDPLGIRDRSILETLYASGIRRAELCSLCLCDLDLHSRQILIRHGKGDRQRLVPAGGRAFEWINRYLTAARPLLASSDNPEAPLYVT
ncbi:MAG: tyrosine-type recombinase/integrase, partial [Akkermansiaceae bacterium]|nr:tyrosine-type recombinase/integrase [Akkermansiaceae bacterium]